jgi:hypothetical protein
MRIQSPISNLVGLLLLAVPLALPAGVQQTWLARSSLANKGTNQAVALALDKDGNVIVCGHGTSTNGDFDYLALKYSPTGTRLWVSRYASPTNDQVRSMVVDKESRALLTGTSVTVKYDSDGVERWTAPYGGRALAPDTNGNVYVTGMLDYDYSTVKLDATGSNVWYRSYDRGGQDFSQAVALDASGYIYVAGRVQWYCDRIGCYEKFGVVKYAPSGEQQFAIELPDLYFASALFLPSTVRNLISRGSDIFLIGDTGGPNGDTFTVSKFTQDGTVAWYRYLVATSVEGTTAGTMDPNGNIYLTGRRIKVFPSHVMYQTFKTDNEGNQLWSAQYLGPIPGYHKANAIALDSAGNVYVTGQSPGPGTGNDYATIKYSPDGQELWVQRYDGPAHGDDVATAIAVAPDGSVYVTGWSTTASNLIEITTIKYAQSPGLTLDTNRNAQLQFLGAPGASNRVQATTDFLDWLDLGFSIADTNGCLRFLDTNAPGYPHRFYRMVPP